jgi:hypothetical protein
LSTVDAAKGHHPFTYVSSVTTLLKMGTYIPI